MNKKAYRKSTIEEHPIISIIIAAIILVGFIYLPKTIYSDWLKDQSENKDLSSLAFQEINQFRAENNLSIIKENQEAYTLALYLSKGKLYKRSYMSEAEKKALIKRSSLDENSIFFLGVLQEPTQEELKLLVSRWTSLVTSKEALLNKYNGQGAVACYGRYCSLVLT